MAPSRRSGRGAPASGDDRRGAYLARAAWVAGAGGLIFACIALASYDTADPPSRAVAVFNAPVANLCGRVGALLAYWIYHVLGLGAWVVVAGLAGVLWSTAYGRRVDHPIVRGLGLLIAAVAVASLHQLIWPSAAFVPGASGGVTATVLVGELTRRFALVGTFLVLFAAFAIGAVVAADTVALAAPLLIWRALVRLRDATRALPEHMRELVQRPGAFLATAGAAMRHRDGAAVAEPEADADEDEDDDEYEYVYEDAYEDDEEPGEEDDAPQPDPTGRKALSAEELRAKIAKLPVRMASRDARVARDEDIPRTENFEKYQFPGLDLLKDPDENFSTAIEEAVRRQAGLLEESLQTYGIDAEVVGIESGPAVTLYSVQLAPGTKVAKITAIASDIARSLKAQNIRVVPIMKGRSSIGIEVPNEVRERVRLKELMSGGHANGMVLPMFLGKDASGEPLVADLTRMPHMLIAGTTGSGKSVCMNSILMSWLYTKRPDELKLVLVDPKMVEMSQFADIPHLMCPVVTESVRATAIMEWAVERMEERYELLKEARVRDIASYNALTPEDLFELFEAQSDEEKARIPKQLPYMVFVVDELADMMMTCKEVEHAIVRIAQKARAVGIHLILATQRPQANVVTGLIKANMPCRVSFKVSSGMDSRIVLDSKGAELLLGQGDMMVINPHSTELRRAQGTLVEDREIRAVTKFLKAVAGPTFERSLMRLKAPSPDAAGEFDEGERDPLFDEAVDIMIESGRGSVSLLQRRLSIGYGRASRLVDQMGLAGILGDHKGSVAREVMITMEDWQRMKAMESGDETEGEMVDAAME